MSETTCQYDLLVIGNLTFDTIHEVDRVPEVDETGLVLRRSIFYGGRAGNISIIGTKLGLDVAIASIVGGDFIESGYRNYLLERKVNIDKVKILKAQECAKTQVFRQQNGKHVYFFQPNVQKYVHSLDFKEEELKEFKVIYLTSFNSENSIQELMRNLRHFDSTFFGLGEEVYRKSRGFLRSAIEISSYLHLNEKESVTLLEKMGLSAISEIFDIGSKLKFVCVSLGEKGSMVYTRDEKHFIPPVPPTEVISTLGAGDAYVAGLAYGIINQWNIKECGRLGSVLSSFILEREGAQNRVPDWSSLRKRYNQFFGELPQKR